MDDLSDIDTLAGDPPTTSFLGAALPPVPHKLVERIESGAFVDMGELLPGNITLIDEEQKQKSKHFRVSYNRMASGIRNILVMCDTYRYIAIFQIYINTLPSAISDGVLLQYADDTTLICCGKDPLTVATSMNLQLKNVQNWLADNRMQLNIGKSCVIWFHTRRQRNQSYPDVVVGSTKLQVATKQKYLGLMFDSTLSWSDQVSRTCQKMAFD